MVIGQNVDEMISTIICLLNVSSNTGVIHFIIPVFILLKYPAMLKILKCIVAVDWSVCSDGKITTKTFIIVI